MDANIARALAAAFKRCGGGSVDVLLTGDEEMRHLNRDWRGKDKATDVLSFPADEPCSNSSLPFVGDIAIGYGVARRDADAKGLGMDAHVSHLFVHGYLHLLGHDHEEDEDAERMEALERDILRDLGYGDPYI